MVLPFIIYILIDPFPILISEFDVKGMVIEISTWCNVRAKGGALLLVGCEGRGSAWAEMWRRAFCPGRGGKCGAADGSVGCSKGGGGNPLHPATYETTLQSTQTLSPEPLCVCLCCGLALTANSSLFFKDHLRHYLIQKFSLILLSPPALISYPPVLCTYLY